MLQLPCCWLTDAWVLQKCIVQKIRVILAFGQCNPHPLHAAALKYIFLLLGICLKLKKEVKCYFFFSRLLLLSLPEANLKYRKVNRNKFSVAVVVFNPLSISRHPGGSAYGCFTGCFCQICVHHQRSWEKSCFIREENCQWLNSKRITFYTKAQRSFRLLVPYLKVVRNR